MHVPKYRKNPDGRAFIEYRGKRRYLGRFGSAESRKLYKEFVSSLMADPVLPDGKQRSWLTVADLALHYLAYAESYYKESGEFGNVRVAVMEFAEKHGAELAGELSPRLLLNHQKQLIKADFARTSINAKVNRLKRWLRWCVSRELLAPDILTAMESVPGLRAGRTEAKEIGPVQAVSLAVVEATLQHVSPVVAAMARIQYLCGMRPDEVCLMRLCDIDTSRAVWLYEPQAHKNAWRGKKLVKAIPLVAQKLLQPWLPADPEAWIFTPRQSRDWWARQVPRKSKVFPHELRMRAQAKHRAVARRWSTASYGKAIKSGVDRANRNGMDVPHWTPNQLRHAIAQELSRLHGQQVAQRWLGHARLDTTEHYVGRQVAELLQIAALVDALAPPAAGGQ